MAVSASEERRWIPSAVLALELGVAAQALASMLSCEVAVAERVTAGGEAGLVELLALLALAVVAFVALRRRDARQPGTIRAAARALAPLGLLAITVVRARWLRTQPSFAEVVL